MTNLGNKLSYIETWPMESICDRNTTLSSTIKIYENAVKI